jgi:uncharacterized protein with PQ loop repeat
MKIEIELPVSLSPRTLAICHTAAAAIGAAVVYGIYHMLVTAVGAVATLMPFVAGGLLFVTLVGTFYFLVGLLKDMRKRPSLRVSFWDCYTAVAVFTVMGFMATACMHVFQGSGDPLSTWNSAGMAAGVFAVFFGIARFSVDLFKDGGANKSR